ncbi:ABC transporter permease [Burkholderia sp. TSV86]|uniref:ABC transporter permease n=1 Tax=Burkholderia sp. TSV86 TaxID=1385594 RepID=UPI00075F25D8|nr:ABC transporter permease [Burkholderia sp. TSV86]KVE31907.1 hypothetical protein WS68_16680 [Burkholderia sp. TSV86]
MPFLLVVFRLGVKELWSLARDPVLLVLIVYTFSASIYSAATARPDTLHKAPIAIVDEDGSPLAARITSAFFPPQFAPPARVGPSNADHGLDTGAYTFALDIPPDFQRDVLAGRPAQILLTVDATRMTQAFTGSGYVQQIVTAEVDEFVRRHRQQPVAPVDLALHLRFNPNLEQTWFGALMEVINNVTLLSMILTGAALIREREHGTVEHLLVMPITPAQIMLAKIWAMSAVVIVAAIASLIFVVQGLLKVPISGSIPLFVAGMALHLFATTSLGILLATLVRNMPQLGMLMVLTILPLQLLSGSLTPRESMPELVQDMMLAAPTTHFVALSQAILYRGAALDTVWPSFVALAGIGALLFVISLSRFRATLGRMA